MAEDIAVSKDVMIHHLEILEKVLGRGSYGVVYCAMFYGTEVAAKRFHPIFFDSVSKEESAGVLRSLKNELSISSLLHHPNIVQFYGVYNLNASDGTRLTSTTYIVTELMEKSLRARNVEENKLKYPKIIQILLDVASGLCYLHNRREPIMHRDLSSKNVLLTSTERAKIADLGVAKVMASQGDSHTRHPGTDLYMPVETMMAGVVYDYRIDVYSFGIICMELCIGRDPQATQALRMVGNKVQVLEETERRQQDFAALEKSENRQLQGLIMKCVAPHENRISALDAVKDLVLRKKSCHMATDLEVASSCGNVSDDEKKSLHKECDRKIAELQSRNTHLQSRNTHLEEKVEKMEKKYRERIELQQKSTAENKNADTKRQNASHTEPSFATARTQQKPMSQQVTPSSLKSSHNVYANKHGQLVVASNAPSRGRAAYSYASQHARSMFVSGSGSSGIQKGSSEETKAYSSGSDTRKPFSSPVATDIRYPPSLQTSSSKVVSALKYFEDNIEGCFTFIRQNRVTTELADIVKRLWNIMCECESYLTSVSEENKKCDDVSVVIRKLNQQLDLLEKAGLKNPKFNSNDRNELFTAARVLSSSL